MNIFQESRKAFTLIELLVVVAIIGLLAAVVLVSLGGARDSAKVARMVSDLNQIEKAFQLWGLNEGWAEWPDETNFGSTGPTIRYLIDNTAFSEHITQAPTPPFGNNYGYRVYSDGFMCGEPVYYGATIYVPGVTQETAEELDLIIDNNDTADLECGKFRWRSNFGGQIWYGISGTNNSLSF